MSTPPEIRLLQRFQRRWPVALLGLLATVLLAVAVLSLVPARYVAKADLLLTPPPAAPTATTNGNPNPYIQLGGLLPLADVVARNMMSSGVRTQLHAKGVSSSYTVVRDTTTDGPLLTVTTTGNSPAAALKDLSTIIGAAGPQLNQLQSGETVPAKDRVKIAAVAKDSVASISRKSQIRAMLVAVVGGLVGTAVAVSVVDSILARRRARRLRRPRTTAQAAVEPAPTANGNGLARPVAVRSRSLLAAVSSRLAPRSATAGDGDAGQAAVDGADLAAPAANPTQRSRPLPGPEPLDAAAPVRSGRRIRPHVSPPPSQSPEAAEPNGRDPEAHETGADVPGRGSDSRVGTRSP